MKEDLEEHIDYLVELLYSVPVNGKITMLTGSNASGKSLIRKQLPFQISKETGKDKKSCVASTSMEARTSSNPAWGALGGAMQDLGWMATSFETFYKIEGLLDNAKDRYIVIDEPEIGMGEETVIALVDYLNEKFDNLDESVDGVMIITHNRYIVEHLNYDNFMNTDGIETKDEWLNRELIPTDLKALKENKLFEAIRDRSKRKEEKENGD